MGKNFCNYTCKATLKVIIGRTQSHRDVLELCKFTYFKISKANHTRYSPYLGENIS